MKSALYHSLTTLQPHGSGADGASLCAHPQCISPPAMRGFSNPLTHSHAHSHDHASDRRTVRVVTVTISDTRTAIDDTSGEALREALLAAGHVIVRHELVPDEPARVRDVITRAIDSGEADAVVSTGGTGIAPRDQTYEAVHALLDKTLDGFGEAFRRLSWDEIGPRAMLSRAVAGTYQTGLVFALPGSTAAVRLGVERLILPVLSHAVELLRA